LAEQPPDVLPTEEAAGKPIAFKLQEKAKLELLNNPGTPPTTRRDCDRVGGHGGADGTRTYYPNSAIDLRTGKVVLGPRVCEICGEVDV